MIVRVPWLPWRAAGITVFPFIFLTEDYPSIRRHERTHLKQQARWAMWGAFWLAASSVVCSITHWWPPIWAMLLGAYGGPLAWYFLYLCVLPVKWNQWRRKWETEAYRAQGFTEASIALILRKSPYWLS